MFESESAGLLDRMRAASRAENRAAGERLAAIADLDALRLRQFGERETWCGDTWDAICAEVAAALQISQALAASFLNYARAMRNRLPHVGAALLAGDIGYATFQTVVYRTDLITDPEVLARVDAALAARLTRWVGMTRGRLNASVDRIVARADKGAVRRRRERQAGREFSIWDVGDGLTEVFGRLLSTDAHAVDAKLTALAATVCHGDPRTAMQRRADAMGAMAAGAERLPCRCGQPGCPAGGSRVPSSVMIHVIANQSTVAGAGAGADYGYLVGSDALIPAELIAELAGSARLRPVAHPADAPPERGHLPSQALADFVRCRDLTCRFPGCDRPAAHTDLDHTIAYADGGVTHAANLKCLCRQHHLIKTFWGWHDQQLPDGTVIWTAPSGHTSVTTPGSAVLFPTLCAPTGVPLAAAAPVRDRCADRALKMPRRRRSRARHRAAYVAAERRRNGATATQRQAPPSEAAGAHARAATGPAPPDDPPF